MVSSSHYGIVIGGALHGRQMVGEAGVPWIQDADMYLPCNVNGTQCWIESETTSNLQTYLGVIVWWAQLLGGWEEWDMTT